MVDYKAYKHKQTGSIWVPFYIIKPDGQEILMS